jgi:hypothetical protein
LSVLTGEPLNESFSGNNPQSVVIQPIYRTLQATDKDIAGFLFAGVAWENLLPSILPKETNGIQIVLKNSCSQAVTYYLNGTALVYISNGDVHDPTYEHQYILFGFLENYLESEYNISEVNGHCLFYLAVYPTDTFIHQHKLSSIPILFTIIIATFFALMVVIFLTYDHYVELQNKKVLKMALQSNAFVTSLFPSNVATRLLEDDSNDHLGVVENSVGQANNTLTVYLRSDNLNVVNDEHDGFGYKTKPIADLFPETTVMFSDIAGMFLLFLSVCVSMIAVPFLYSTCFFDIKSVG